MSQSSFLNNLIAFIQRIFEEIWLNIAGSLRSTPEIRLRWLRFMYYEDADITMNHRRAKDVVREFLDKAYYDYYHRFLSAERLAKQQLDRLHQGARGDELLHNMQGMSEKIIVLIDQLQNLDKSMSLYQADTAEMQQLQESRNALRARIEAALNAQAKIPIKMLTLTTAADTRSFDRLNESIDRLTNRLDDIAASYDDVRAYGDLDTAIRHLEDSQ